MSITPEQIKTPPAGHKILKGNKLDASPKATKFQVCSVNGVPLDTSVTTWFPLSQTKSIYIDPEQLDSDLIIVTDWIYNAKDELHG